MKGLAVPEMEQRTPKMCVIQTNYEQRYYIAKRARLPAAASFSISCLAALKQDDLCKELPNMCSDQPCATLDYHLQKSLDDNAESHDYLGHLDMTESSLSSHLVMTMALCYPRTYQVHVFMILLTTLKCEHLSIAHVLQQPAMTSPVYPQHVSANVLQAV